jgi:Tol biopolymer transport system component
VNIAGPSLVGNVYVHDRTSKKTKRVSRRPNGKLPNGPSESPDISGNGRYVVYSSNASNIVPKDTNGTWDVFVYDRQSGKTRRVSVKSNGKQAKGPSTDPAISANGRFVAFVSEAKNLVKADTSFTKDIYVHDRATGKTRRVSIRSNGNEANSFSLSPRLSADGRIVTFESFAANLVKNDNNGKYDIFTHDRATGNTRRVSVRTNGAQSAGDSGGPDISANGRFVTFWSRATDLVSNDDNLVNDVFVHDRKSRKTKRVSVATGGAQAKDHSHSPAIDAKGKAVVFVSDAKNLIPADGNGVFDVFYRGPLR